MSEGKEADKIGNKTSVLRGKHERAPVTLGLEEGL